MAVTMTPIVVAASLLPVVASLFSLLFLSFFTFIIADGHSRCDGASFVPTSPACNYRYTESPIAATNFDDVRGCSD